MTDRESCVICELEEMLDESEDTINVLAAENSDLKDLLIGSLLEINEFKQGRINELEDVIFGESLAITDEFCE